MKKVGVIVPCYNAEEYIDRCMDSLINQTLGIDHMELFFVDDASTDGTYEKLLQYEKQYPESICVIHCEENHRQGAARNIALQYVTAEYVGYVDIDDWCEYNMFEIMYSRAAEYECDFVFCDFVRDDGISKDSVFGEIRAAMNREDELYILDDDNKVKEFLVAGKCGTAPWQKLCKKSILVDNDISFLENISYEDNYWSGLLFLYAKRICRVSQKLYHYYVNDNSTTLIKNNTRHYELFDVIINLWEEYKKRGLYKIYGDALEYHFIRAYYWQGMKMLCIRFDNPDYAVFVKMCETVNLAVPDWADNHYIKDYTTEFYQQLISLTRPVPAEADFAIIVSLVRKYYGAE